MGGGGGSEWVGRGAGVSEFFSTMNPFKIFFFRWGDRGLEQVIYFHTASKSKKKFFFCGGGGGGVGRGHEGDVGGGSWMHRQTSPKPICPSTSSKLGA